MGHHTFPLKGGYCRDCEEKAKSYAKKAEKIAPIGQELLDRFFEQDNAPELLEWGGHASQRSFERSFSERTFFEALSEGWAINYNSKEQSVLVMSHIKLGKGVYRPVHIPVIIETRDGITTAFAKTVYDPKASSHLWDERLENRICWCKPYEL